MKKTAKLLSIILALIMCLGALPISASAATTVDVRADSSKYTYNSSTNTLTLLDGFSANQQPSVHGDYSAQIYANGNLNIVVNGNCYIFMQSVGSNAGYAAGIFCTGRLNISGTGTLNITNSATYPNHSAAGIIALSSLGSNITGGQSAVTIGGGVKVNIDVPSARWSYGIIGNLNLNNAKLSITTGNSVYGSYGIYASRWYVDSPSAELTVNCNDTESGSCLGFYGVLNYRCGNMTVTSQEEVCDGMYNLLHTATVYCNTAPTSSTTLWDKTTNWGNYKYIKVIDNISVATSGVTLNKSTLSITKGSTATLTATVAPSNATNKDVRWESSNLSVASVNNGVVTAKAEGTATITVRTTDGGRTATCAVTVTPAGVAVTGVTLNKQTLSLTVGNTSTLTATVSPSNATNKAVTWTSTNSSVASVSSTGVVTAKAAGTATITVKTADGNKTATCAVTVTPATVAVTGVSLNHSTLSIPLDYWKDLIATVTPSNATNKNVTWTSSNSTVASVSSDGRITTNGVGTAIITVKTADGNKTASCTVTVPADVEINSVTVTGVTPPVAGKKAKFSCNTPSDAEYSATNTAWVETDYPITSVEQLEQLEEDSEARVYYSMLTPESFVFQIGKYYTLVVYLNCSAHIGDTYGHCFLSSTSATLNGQEPMIYYDSDLPHYLDLYYCFPLTVDPTIYSVNVTGVTPPVVGKTASFDYSIQPGEGYSINPYTLDNSGFAIWVETDVPVTSHEQFDNTATYYIVGQDSFEFKADKYYTFVTMVIADEYLCFSESTSTSINGNEAVVYIVEEEGVQFYYHFGKPAAESVKALSSISVTTQPTKKTYIVGESFNKAGMVVKANYSDGTSATITNYTVTNGSNLPAGRTSVTISYTEGGVTKTTTVPITVYSDVFIPTVAIKNNPGTRTINYGDGIEFTAVVTDMPAGAQIKWYVNGAEKGTGNTFTFSDAQADATITVKIVDGSGNALTDAGGSEISASEKITVKAGFFQKLISFFKNLFRIGRITVQKIY